MESATPLKSAERGGRSNAANMPRYFIKNNVDLALQVDELWNEASIDYVRADGVHEAIQKLSGILQRVAKSHHQCPHERYRSILGGHGNATGLPPCLEHHSAKLCMT